MLGVNLVSRFRFFLLIFSFQWAKIVLLRLPWLELGYCTVSSPRHPCFQFTYSFYKPALSYSRRAAWLLIWQPSLQISNSHFQILSNPEIACQNVFVGKEIKPFAKISDQQVSDKAGRRQGHLREVIRSRWAGLTARWLATWGCFSSRRWRRKGRGRYCIRVRGKDITVSKGRVGWSIFGKATKK